MKRTYNPDASGSSALKTAERLPVEISDVEVDRMSRAEALLKASHQDQLTRVFEEADEQVQRRAEKEAARLRAAQEHARASGLEHSLATLLGLEEEDGSMSFGAVVHVLASPEINDLMDNHKPLMTGLMWDELNVPDRYKLLKRSGMPLDKVVCKIFDILPAVSKEYLLRWQRQINLGAPWHLTDSVITTAEHLIRQGFLLFSRDAAPDDAEHTMPSRKARPGQPGSPAFVRAVMGKEYLAWLLANEVDATD